MYPLSRILLTTTVAALVAALPLHSQDNGESSSLTAETFSGLKLRALGPALMGGRIADIAINPEDPSTWYLAVGSGNVWKTENAGITWRSDLRRPDFVFGGLGRARPLEPRDRLGRHWGECQRSACGLGRWGLQEHRWRGQLAAYGARELPAHRQDPGRSSRWQRGVRRGRRAPVVRRRRSRSLQEHRRRGDLEPGARHR